jgi:hypothetical protein
MNYRMSTPGPNPYEGLFGLIGTILGNNARQKQEANMYSDVADFTNNLNDLDMGGQTNIQDLASRENPNSNYLGSNVERKTTQGLFNTNFNQAPPTSDTLGQGLFGQALRQPAGAQGGNQFSQQAGMYGSTQQPQNFNFSNPMDKYSKENNPAKVTTSAPKNLNEQTALIRSQIAPAMKELIAKGYNPKDVLPLLQQATQDKIAEHTSNYQQQQVNDLYQGFIAEENPNKKAMYAARLKNLGYDVTTPYKEFAPTYQAEKVNTGGQQLGLSFNPKTGRYEQQFAVNNTVSPDTQLNNDTRLRTAQMHNATTLQAAASRGGRGGGSGGTGKTGTGMTYSQYEKANKRYDEILQDIWDSPSAQSRTGKKNSYKDELNTLGQLLDKDVNNDVSYIPTGWVDPKGGGI